MDKSFSKTISFKDPLFWQNIWFYYKKHIFAGLALIVFFTWGIVSCVNTVYPDYQIMYVGKYGVQDTVAAEEYLSEFVTDANGDGKTVPRVVNIALGNQENPQMTYAYISKLDVEISQGDASVFIMNSAFIDRYSQLECYVYLDDIADSCNIPEERRIREKTSGKTIAIDISGTVLCDKLRVGEDGNQPLYFMMNVPKEKSLKNEKKAAVFEETKRVSEIILKSSFRN